MRSNCRLPPATAAAHKLTYDLNAHQVASASIMIFGTAASLKRLSPHQQQTAVVAAANAATTAPRAPAPTQPPGSELRCWLTSGTFGCPLSNVAMAPPFAWGCACIERSANTCVKQRGLPICADRKCSNDYCCGRHTCNNTPGSSITRNKKIRINGALLRNGGTEDKKSRLMASEEVVVVVVVVVVVMVVVAMCGGEEPPPPCIIETLRDGNGSPPMRIL